MNNSCAALCLLPLCVKNCSHTHLYQSTMWKASTFGTDHISTASVTSTHPTLTHKLVVKNWINKTWINCHRYTIIGLRPLLGGCGGGSEMPQNQTNINVQFSTVQELFLQILKSFSFKGSQHIPIKFSSIPMGTFFNMGISMANHKTSTKNTHIASNYQFSTQIS